MTFIGDGRLIYNVRPLTLVGGAFASVWTLGVLAILFRHRSSAEWRRGPGFVACAAATAGAIFKLTGLMSWGIARDWRSESWYVPTVVGQSIDPAATGVLTAWLTLLLVGAWRRERTWPDNLGIFVGLLWIYLYVMAWAALCLE